LLDEHYKRKHGASAGTLGRLGDFCRPLLKGMMMHPPDQTRNSYRRLRLWKDNNQ
jgi:hypothetical protein